MNRLEAMSVVLAVAEAGSLSAAARRQKTPLATVSRKVSELEAHLRTKLFNRSTRALVPTDAGRSYIAAAKRILADVAEAERAASGEYTTPRGDLSISAPVALGRSYVQPVVAQFLAAFPANLFFGFVVSAIVVLKLSPDLWLSPLMILGTQWYILFNVIVGASAIAPDLRYAGENPGCAGGCGGAGWRCRRCSLSM